MNRRIGIIDADLLDNGTRHPNLALMKISGYNKSMGNSVTLLEDYNKINEFDTVFISKVFNFTYIPDEEKVKKLKNVKIGGTGFFEDGGDSLPYEIEHHMPDYYLYNEYIEKQINNGKSRKRYTDYLDYSIGFTTRGCFRKCSFCVNKKYDRVLRHSKVSEFLDISRRKIYLWDDNFLAYENWEQVLDEIIETKKPFQFRQGLDIRLMTEKKAKKFSQSKYSGDFIFAFDHLKDKELIQAKLKIWKKHCKKTTKLYVLCGYNSQDENDIIDIFERIKILMKYGCLPYIMRYEKYKSSPYKGMYIQIARWCNQPQFYKKKSFREFCEANQEYHKTKGTYCSAYRAMMEFEQKFPKIAQKYFDIKFENVNRYKK